jgi:hypothetical protein
VVRAFRISKGALHVRRLRLVIGHWSFVIGNWSFIIRR